MLPRIGRLIDSHTDGVIDKTEFEPRVVGLRQRLSQLQERHRAQRLKELESRSTFAWHGADAQDRSQPRPRGQEPCSSGCASDIGRRFRKTISAPAR
jgi:hypothetical protein